ncbi:hypothetical protein HDC94_000921 [Leifsonia sp. AK011]|uniref:hypothetical protein n=1 Tax=Leifsonia sp. AK011 TaxID=2723075 RepID=UPI0015C6BB7D|nr:hypothetical protein [Leifsonia sp. AK011]NYF09765.1 hypothetical protein [Leifsonia sp. AK011]
MVDYVALPALRHFVLEDSYVLEILESGDTVSIRMDLVYAKDHPELRPPRLGEWAYVREGVLRFSGVTEFEWTDRSVPAREPDGSRSWDGLEVFRLQGREYQLAGDVGSLRIVAQRLEVEMTGPI